MIGNLPSRIFILLILFLSIGQLPASGTVLCFGYDGNVAIERVKLTCCVHPIEIQQKSINTLSFYNSISDFDHCRICNDISLSNNNFESKIVSANTYLADFKLLSLYFITIDFPHQPINETTPKSYIEKDRTLNYFHLPQMEKVVILC